MGFEITRETNGACGGKRETKEKEMDKNAD